MRFKVCSFALFAITLAPACSRACTNIGTIADGRVSAPILVTNSTDVTFSFPTTGFHTYSAEVTLVQEGFLASLDLEININTSPCLTTDMTGPSTALDTTLNDPVLASGRRVSFLAVGSVPTYFVNVHNFGVSAHLVTFSVVDTTMFSPAWITNGSYDTFYSFFNTTSSPILGDLLLTPSSSPALLFGFSVPANGAYFTNTAALGVPRNQVGTAIFSNLGTPGAILATASINNFTTSPAYNQPIEFRAVRAAH